MPSHHNSRSSGSSNRRHNGDSSLFSAFPDPRPSRAVHHERQHRLKKEKECGAFTWIEGVELALMGAAVLFSVDRTLSKKNKNKNKY